MEGGCLYSMSKGTIIYEQKQMRLGMCKPVAWNTTFLCPVAWSPQLCHDKQLLMGNGKQRQWCSGGQSYTILASLRSSLLWGSESWDADNWLGWVSSTSETLFFV